MHFPILLFFSPPSLVSAPGVMYRSTPLAEHYRALYSVRDYRSPVMSSPHAFEPFPSVSRQKDHLLRPSTRSYTSNRNGDLNDALPTSSTMKSSQVGRDDYKRAVSAALALDEAAVVVTLGMEIIVAATRACSRKLSAQLSVKLASPRSRFWTGHPHPRACLEATNRRPPIKESVSETAKIILNVPPPTYEMKSVTTREAIDRRPASGVIVGYTRVLDRASLAKQRIAARGAASCVI
ncbi:hypothetical protein EV714DRAFT_275164 [Schizophyllum commune]